MPTWHAMIAVQACSNALLSSTPGSLPYCFRRSATSRWWVASCAEPPEEQAFLCTPQRDSTGNSRASAVGACDVMCGRWRAGYAQRRLHKSWAHMKAEQT